MGPQPRLEGDLLEAEGGEPPKRVAWTVLDSRGEVDLSAAFLLGASEHKIPVALALACAKAESGLNIQAERYGEWPDVSFGIGQRIVLYHYVGDRSSDPGNIALVRSYVFSHPERDIQEMCSLLGFHFAAVGPDEMAVLGAYNTGRYLKEEDGWFGSWQAQNYRRALAWAYGLIGA